MLDDLRYLECNGLIEVGKYEVLLETKLTDEPYQLLTWHGTVYGKKKKKRKGIDKDNQNLEVNILFSRFISQTNKKLSKYNYVNRLLYFAIQS